MGTEFVSYYEKLRDPRWQRKRLEILQRDDFTCTYCGDKEQTLNVHHGYYERGFDPWDYESDTLWTLCEACHAAFVQPLMRDIHREIAKLGPSKANSLMGVLSSLSSLAIPEHRVNALDFILGELDSLVSDDSRIRKNVFESLRFRSEIMRGAYNG